MVLSVRVRAFDEKREDILRSLKSLVGPTSAEAACASCLLFQDPDDPNWITFIQAWTSRHELQRHVRAHQYRHLLSILDLSRAEPAVRLDDVAAVGGGIEVLAAMAACGHPENPKKHEGGMK